ncbi:mucin-5AC-like isoform X2 [Hemiscyllium ocellatum]|uniref:mucin-5AC-like isoform X2 n=1 Tax=Hemiscyllium ocellatum TaxID=170820 RepID=UPI002966E6D8|nr:mucin-5AC-like isoform X2 [Hemiscyllium ocellatum]
MPETAVPAYHCSTEASGWLNGTHPTESQGKTDGTVCFNWKGNICSWTEQITIQNCSNYFVYYLKKTRKQTKKAKGAYCTVSESGNTDPCVSHKVLVDPWRSLNCTETECTGKAECDVQLKHGWYRFKSSGGWKMPEVAVPPRHCSTRGTAWLQGSHPTVADGEVTRRVCINWDKNPCYWVHEIKIKNCSSYFVYELKALPQCAAYCTVLQLLTSHGTVGKTTRTSSEISSSKPISSSVPYSAPKRLTSHGAVGKTTPTSSEISSSKPVSSSAPYSDPNAAENGNDTTYSTQKPTESSSSNRAVAAETAPKRLTSHGAVGKTTPTSSEISSSKPVSSSAPYSDPNAAENGNDTTYSTQKPTESSSSNRAVAAETAPKRLTSHGAVGKTTPTSSEISSSKPVSSSAPYSDPNTAENGNDTTYSTQKPTESSSSNRAVAAETVPKRLTSHGAVGKTTPTSSEISSSKPMSSSAPYSDPNTAENGNDTTYSTQKPTESSSSNRAVAAETDPNTAEHGDDTTYSTQKPMESLSSNRAVTAETESTSPATEPPTECKRADDEHLTPVMLDLSEEDCEHINGHAQVMYVGRNKLDTSDYLEKVQMMLKDHLPCKNLLPKLGEKEKKH